MTGETASRDEDGHSKPYSIKQSLLSIFHSIPRLWVVVFFSVSRHRSGLLGDVSTTTLRSIRKGPLDEIRRRSSIGVLDAWFSARSFRRSTARARAAGPSSLSGLNRGLAPFATRNAR